VQRTSVSIVANTLQRAGLIRYRRGQLDAGHQSEFQARGAAREGNPGSDKDPEARERELSRPCSARDRGTAPAWNRRAVRFPAI
jgi:hypothetical protein